MIPDPRPLVRVRLYQRPSELTDWHWPQCVITGLDPVTSRGTVPRMMAGSVAGHDVLNDCAKELVISAVGITPPRPSIRSGIA
jgi:hypothetical protein